MNFLLFLILLVPLGNLTLTSCSTLEPKLEPDLKLELKDVSCTEAWLQLTTSNIHLPATINLLKNNSISQVYILNTQDSLLYIDSLLPNQIYKLLAAMQPYNNTSAGKSNELNVTTMDTTSHNFTWQTFTFGQHSSSTLYDVAIINENDIWAVGEIYMNDSLGNPDPICYNSAHWNGQLWELKRIPILLNGTPFYPIIKSIFAFNQNDIWFEAGIHWDGITFKQIPFNIQWDGNVNKLWGSSSNDLYAVGNNGNIAHYSNGSWSKIESGMDVNLKDVYGTNEGSILWISGKTDLYKSVLYKVESGQIKKVFEDSSPWHIQTGKISGGILSIWTNSESFVYLTTPINAYRSLSNTNGDGKEIYPFNDGLNGGTARIRGTDVNNIVTAGANSSILHFNGYSWEIYSELLDNLTLLSSVDIKENTIVSVGNKMENNFLYRAVIIVGKK